MMNACDEYRDDLGVRHALKPVDGRYFGGYGHYYAPHYPCGCRPAAHRFKCAYCDDVVGWCLGCADELPGGCDDCWARMERGELDPVSDLRSRRPLPKKRGSS